MAVPQKVAGVHAKVIESFIAARREAETSRLYGDTKARERAELEMQYYGDFSVILERVYPELQENRAALFALSRVKDDTKSVPPTRTTNPDQGDTVANLPQALKDRIINDVPAGLQDKARQLASTANNTSSGMLTDVYPSHREAMAALVRAGIFVQEGPAYRLTDGNKTVLL